MALSMVVALGVSAMAIDVASWYQKHHQAQVAADAGALAAANCLANSGSGEPCTSGTDVSDAQQMAVTYAGYNGIKITTSDVSVNTTSDTVTVTATSTAPAFFANLFGIHSATVSSGSEAAWTTGGGAESCTSSAQSAGSCYSIYGAGSACAVSATSAYIDLTGIVHSQGGLSLSNGTYNVSSSPTYVNTSCTSSGSSISNTPVQTSALTGSCSPYASWFPECYSSAGEFPACSTNCITLDGLQVPPYCTQVTTSSSGFTLTTSAGTDPKAGNVYCSVGSGTGVKSDDPSTWTGPINLQVTDNTAGSWNGSSCTSYLQDTFIGGTISIESGSGPTCLEAVNYPGTTASSNTSIPDPNDLLFYASQSGGITISGASTGWCGDFFAPRGSISITQTGSTSQVNKTLLEGQTISLGGISMAGDGPQASSTTGSLLSGGSGSDSLIN